MFESGGGVELGGVEAGLSGVALLGGVVVSPGAAVVPGAVDWSDAGGGEVVVSAGAELAEPAGEVDSCLEQAPNSASEPTHNNRTLRFIRSPHYCNGTVTRALPAWTQRRGSRKTRSGVAASRRTWATIIKATPMPRAPSSTPWYPSRFLGWERSVCDSRRDHGLGEMPAAGDSE